MKVTAGENGKTNTTLLSFCVLLVSLSLLAAWGGTCSTGTGSPLCIDESRFTLNTCQTWGSLEMPWLTFCSGFILGQNDGQPHVASVEQFLDDEGVDALWFHWPKSSWAPMGRDVSVQVWEEIPGHHLQTIRSVPTCCQECIQAHRQVYSRAIHTTVFPSQWLSSVGAPQSFQQYSENSHWFDVTITWSDHVQNLKFLVVA